MTKLERPLYIHISGMYFLLTIFKRKLAWFDNVDKKMY